MKTLNLRTEETLLLQDRSQRIYRETEGWVIEYPIFNELADKQMHSFWPHNEPLVDNDINDLRIKCTDSERHAILIILKLFTHYERKAGDEYWSTRIMKAFKRPEIQRMAAMFAAVELNSHAPFYNKINECLFINTPEFYSDWKNYTEFTDRMSFINTVVESEDDLISVGGFTFIEGVVLYSSFAFLKHFQAQDYVKNLIPNICRGINLSVSDENLHAVGGSQLYRTLKKERNLTPAQEKVLSDVMYKVASEVYIHESKVIDMIFAEEITGITKDDLLEFIKHRINLCLSDLELAPLFEITSTTISDWFYININSINMHDFFSGSGSEYHIDWNEDAFGKIWSDNVVGL